MTVAKFMLQSMARICVTAMVFPNLYYSFMVVAKGVSMEAVIVVATVDLTVPSNWWQDINDSSLCWLYGIFTSSPPSSKL
ncbi:hypothetical protein SESBI_37642 [Sesbania bispinosa]|nr:hypothetical protein SESBI_37642 [Sesbania bispinosa]